MKKILKMSLVCFIVLSMFSNVFAAELNTKLEVIQKDAEIKQLENDQGSISKSIVKSNENTGEVIINLSLNNVSQNEKYDHTEIYIIVSENIVHDTEKLNEYISNIETLSTKIFEKSSNTKIGIIGMKGTIDDTEMDENGKMIWGENDESDVEGTANNAEIVANLTQDIENIKSGLQAMNNSKIKYHLNLQSAIKLANQSYSENANKLLITLYDGVPSIAIGVANRVRLSGYTTVEEAVKAKYEKVVNKTKTEILSLKDNNVELILLRPDDTSYDSQWYDTSTGELACDFDGSPYVQGLYGTIENPTYGKMYSLSDDNLAEVVVEGIYQDIMEDIRIDIKSAVIKEYFSNEILENFDITFANENIDTTDLLTNKYIVWNIGEVVGNETAKLEYTLKIKDMKNEKLLNQVISTSEKTELTYINYLDTEKTVISTNSPKVKLSEIIEELIANVSYDPSTETKEKVTVTIKTNKKVNVVDGWDLSENGMTLTKVYSTNITEIVHLVDEDNMKKDVEIKIVNIKDDSLAKDKIPPAGLEMKIISILAIVIIGSAIIYLKNIKLSDI